MPGTVTSQVQGSRRRPYDVILSVPVLRDAGWKRIIPALAGQAAYGAALLAGELPHDIEELFKQLGISLFPTARQLTTECSCPDWGNPCKHAAAVCYLLAERFDADPFTVLALRGMSREPLLAAIGAHRANSAEGSAASPAPDDADELSGFWNACVIPLLPPPSDAAADWVLDRLGPIGVTVRGSDLSEVLRPAYMAMKAPRVVTAD